MSPRYAASERKWVMQLLARMTPAERKRYEEECATAGRHHNSGKLYDGKKAEIAERIMLESRRVSGEPVVSEDGGANQ